MNSRQKRKASRNFILGARRDIEEYLGEVLMCKPNMIVAQEMFKKMRATKLITLRGGRTEVTQKGLDLLSGRLYP